ncbi:MAG: prepilin-type N-terminal cleavage/methylation domain-containing protein [Candidatus Gastranaerophilales bacterium]|nr:prepilin-type N-terminal cleavage/methylation domain-containing protein [Candidatus Gastranaerophilales bacterium]
MSKKAFTLAEVLITLVIIGVIAAITIPSLLNNTNKEEYKTALKKSVSTLNNAISMEYAHTGKNIEDFTSVNDLQENLFKKRMNVVSVPTGNETPIPEDEYSLFEMPAYAGSAPSSIPSDEFIYTADGIGYYVEPMSVGDCKYTSEMLDPPCFGVVVDVNGSKGPNKITTFAYSGTVAGSIASIFEQPAWALISSSSSLDLKDQISVIYLYDKVAVPDGPASIILQGKDSATIGK